MIPTPTSVLTNAEPESSTSFCSSRHQKSSEEQLRIAKEWNMSTGCSQAVWLLDVVPKSRAWMWSSPNGKVRPKSVSRVEARNGDVTRPYHNAGLVLEDKLAKSQYQAPSNVDVPPATSFPVAFFLDIDAFRYRREVISVPFHPIPPEILSSLSDLDMNVHQIVAAYFSTIHSWMPFISKLRVQQIVTGNQEFAPDFALLLLCMKVLVTNSAAESASMKTSLYRLAKHFYSTLEEAEIVTLRMLQSLVLLSLYEIGHGILPAAYFTVGNAARMAQVVGIQSKDQSREVLGFSSTFSEAEERRRTWWSILILDRFVLLGRLNQSCLIRNPSGDDSLPGETSSWDIGQATGNSAVFISSDVGVITSPFARTCQGANLLGRVLSHHEDKILEPTFRTAEATQLAQTTKALSRALEYSILDTAVGITSNFNNFMEIAPSLALCYSSLFTLYKPYHCVGIFIARTSDEVALQEQAINGIEDTSRQVLAFANQILAWISSQDQISAIGPLVADCLYQAGVVYARLVRETGNRESYGGLSKIKTCLARLSSRWCIASKYLAILEGQDKSPPC
ncbi:hypothetical protein B7463_g86, partial [Scytalidium lignicola]